MKNKLFERKFNMIIRITLLVLVGLTLLFAILASSRDVGTYIFDKGSTTGDTIKGTVTGSGAKAKTVYTFTENTKTPIIDSFLYGDQSTLKVSMAFIIAAFIGSIASIVKTFNPKYKNVNFVNSLVITISLVFALGFSSNLLVLIFSIVSLIPASLLLVSSIMVEFKSEERVYI